MQDQDEISPVVLGWMRSCREEREKDEKHYRRFTCNAKTLKGSVRAIMRNLRKIGFRNYENLTLVALPDGKILFSEDTDAAEKLIGVGFQQAEELCIVKLPGIKDSVFMNDPPRGIDINNLLVHLQQYLDQDEDWFSCISGESFEIDAVTFYEDDRHDK